MDSRIFKNADCFLNGSLSDMIIIVELKVESFISLSFRLALFALPQDNRSNLAVTVGFLLLYQVLLFFNQSLKLFHLLYERLDLLLSSSPPSDLLIIVFPPNALVIDRHHSATQVLIVSEASLPNRACRLQMPSLTQLRVPARTGGESVRLVRLPEGVRAREHVVPLQRGQ